MSQISTEDILGIKDLLRTQEDFETLLGHDDDETVYQYILRRENIASVRCLTSQGPRVMAPGEVQYFLRSTLDDMLENLHAEGAKGAYMVQSVVMPADYSRLTIRDLESGERSI